MRTSWKLVNIAGIDIELHISFILFLALFAIFAMSFIPILIILFVSISLHELSHSLMARRYGVKVNKIILLPIGGMAVMKEQRLKPFAEFKMAIAGPLFNFILCSAIVIILALTNQGHLLYTWTNWNFAVEGAIEKMSAPFSLTALIVSTTFWLNWLLGTFNLFLPAIPLDGGRVFRSLLSTFTDYVNATKIATTVSTIVTFFLFMYSILTFNLILLFISIFIYLGANAELEYAMSNKLLAKFPISRLIRSDFLLVEPDAPLDKVLLEMIQNRSLVAITPTKKGVCIASVYDIRHIPKTKWRTTKISKIAKCIKPIGINHDAVYALRKMRQYDTEALPVVSKGQIIGCIFRSDVERVYEILKIMSE